MPITDHGTWTQYEPNYDDESLSQRIKDAPRGSLFARNAQGVDWYDYATTLTPGQTYILLKDGRVANVTDDPTTISPAGLRIVSTTDPIVPEQVRGRVYDFDTNTFSDPPLTPTEMRRQEFKADAEREDMVNRLRTATPAQIRTYVQTQVTDIASARQMFARILLALAMVVRD